MATKDDQDDLPVVFPKGTTLTFEPRQYRRLVEAFRQFGVYEQALEVMEENGVKIVLRSSSPDGVARALAAMQKLVGTSPLYEFTKRLFQFKPEPIEGNGGCPIGKFMIE
jgi:hypothetical protein